jgi:hypothetical protein
MKFIFILQGTQNRPKGTVIITVCTGPRIDREYLHGSTGQYVPVGSGNFYTHS